VTTSFPFWVFNYELYSSYSSINSTLWDLFEPNIPNISNLHNVQVFLVNSMVGGAIICAKFSRFRIKSEGLILHFPLVLFAIANTSPILVAFTTKHIASSNGIFYCWLSFCSGLFVSHIGCNSHELFSSSWPQHPPSKKYLTPIPIYTFSFPICR